MRDEGLVGDEIAQRAIETHPEPDLPEISGPFDARRIAREVAADLKKLYGKRLSQVILFGSWARGDAHPESDIDLLVVLDRVDDVWRELERMSDVNYRHSLSNATVVSAFVVGEQEFADPTTPALIRARIEGKLVA
jgi:predicted nucleotidyltransferase